MSVRSTLCVIASAMAVQFSCVSVSAAHGDVQPQAVDTEGLASLGETY